MRLFMASLRGCTGYMAPKAMPPMTGQPAGAAGAPGLARAATHPSDRRSQRAFYEKHHPRWVPLLRWYLRVRGRALPTSKI